MQPFHEKLLFGFTSLLTTTFSTMGAILTEGETRWVYVTFAASSMTSGFVTLMFKKANDTIQATMGRFGFAILGGILGTKPIIHHLGFEQLVETDIISLGGLSAATCIGTYFIGYACLTILEKVAPSIAAKWLKKLEP
jgi:hypothetical protein